MALHILIMRFSQGSRLQAFEFEAAIVGASVRLTCFSDFRFYIGFLCITTLFLLDLMLKTKNQPSAPGGLVPSRLLWDSSSYLTSEGYLMRLQICNKHA